MTEDCPRGLQAVHDAERIAVEQLGGRIGFGRVMQLCEQIWTKRDPVGALTVGPVASERGRASPDDLREQGWSVAVHNDYTLNGEKFTFWLFTKGFNAIKGEGRTDAEALDQVRKLVKLPAFN